MKLMNFRSQYFFNINQLEDEQNLNIFFLSSQFILPDQRESGSKIIT